MIIDNSLILSSAQAVTTTAVSSSVIDQGAATDAYDGIWCQFLINTAFTSNSATIQFELQTAIDAAFTSPITLAITGAIADTVLVAGYKPLQVHIPIGAKRFFRANYTVSGTAVAGKVDCRIVEDVDVNLP
jgi:hypothetical protein